MELQISHRFYTEISQTDHLQENFCRVDTAGRNEKAIKEYVRNQLQEDIASDQMCLKEFTDPFTGEPVVKGK